MSRLGATDVGELFSKPAGKGRASGLAGTLAPRRAEVPPAPEPSDSIPETTSTAPPANPARAARTTERTARTTPARKPAESAPVAPETVDVTEARGGGVATSQQLVVVYILPEDAEWITAQRKRTSLTNAQVVLAAIEQTAGQLPAALAPAPAARVGMFSTLAKPKPSGDRHVQLGLRGILPEDREVLSSLVEQTGAGSLSALVRAALRLARAE